MTTPPPFVVFLCHHLETRQSLQFLDDCRLSKAGRNMKVSNINFRCIGEAKRAINNLPDLYLQAKDNRDHQDNL